MNSTRKKITSVILIFVMIVSSTNIYAKESTKKEDVLRTQEQIEMIMSYGYSEKEATKMSEKDVVNLLFSDEKPSKEYINKIVSSDTLKDQMLVMRKKEMDSLISMGYNNDEIEKILNLDINWSLKDINAKSEIDKSYEALLLIENSEQTMRSSLTTNNHKWLGIRPKNILNEWNCYFHTDVYPTTVYTPSSVYVGYAPDVNDLGYDEKVDYLEADAQKVVSYTKELYNKTSITNYKYNFFNYGELGSNSRAHTHEGVDARYFYGRGQTIYSQINRIGVVSLASQPSNPESSSTSYLGVYYADLDITLIYEHVKFSTSYTPDVTVIGGNSSVATEWTFGWDPFNQHRIINHTHLQIQRGKITDVNDVYISSDPAGSLDSLSPYNFLLYY